MFWTSLVVQWLRIICQFRGHRFNPWSGKIPQAEAQLSLHTTAETGSRSRQAAATEPACARAHALLVEKPLQRGACAPQRRVAPAPRSYSKPRGNEDPGQHSP